MFNRVVSLETLTKVDTQTGIAIVAGVAEGDSQIRLVVGAHETVNTDAAITHSNAISTPNSTVKRSCTGRIPNYCGKSRAENLQKS